MLRRLSATAALCALLAAPALATEPNGHKAQLHFGPIIGGEDLRFDLRTTVPSSIFAIFYGIDGTPTVVGPAWPAFGMNVGSAVIQVLPTDATGRFQASIPTSVGEFGPAGLGIPLFFQAVVIDQLAGRIGSNVKATEIEPAFLAPGTPFFTQDSAARLPAGWDLVGADRVLEADVNRDGWPDLVMSNSVDVIIWVNQGAANPGHFTDQTATRIAWPSGEPITTIALGDLDADGYVDLLTGGGSDGAVGYPDRLWLNDGTGTFVQHASFPAGTATSVRFTLADLNRDGRLDVVVANGREEHTGATGGTDRLYLNFSTPGVPLWFEEPAFPLGAWNDDLTSTNQIIAGDVERDGDLDLFVVKADIETPQLGGPGQENILLLNDGFGGFTDATATRILPVRSDNSQDAVFADIDGDFDLDIIVTNSVLGVSAANSNDVLVNQGGVQNGVEGFFADDTASFLETSTFADGIRLSVEVGDIDVDGDLDVLLSVHDLFLGADQPLFLNQGFAQGGAEGDMARELWFDPPFAGPFAGLGDCISFDGLLFDPDRDGDLDAVVAGGGTFDPISNPSPDTELYAVRLLMNGTL